MAAPRKIAIFPQLKQLNDTSTYRVWQANNPNTFVAGADVMAEATGVGKETQARIDADAQLEADIAAEATARANADAAEATARANGDAAEASARTSADTTLQNNINAEAGLRANGDTASHWSQLDLSGLPTADPGGGRPWLSGGILRVGPLS